MPTQAGICAGNVYGLAIATYHASGAPEQAQRLLHDMQLRGLQPAAHIDAHVLHALQPRAAPGAPADPEQGAAATPAHSRGSARSDQRAGGMRGGSSFVGAPRLSADEVAEVSEDGSIDLTAI